MNKLFIALIPVFFFFFCISPTLAAGWGEVSSPTTQTLMSLDIYSDNMVSVGEQGTIIYSKDEGDTWTKASSGTSTDLTDVDLFSSTNVIAVGHNGIILRSTDSGVTWTRVTPTGLSDTELTYDLNAVTMASSTTGFVVGENGLVLKTTNGGTSWSKTTSPSENIDLTNIMAASTTTLWVCGESGSIYKTTNGGTSWTSQLSGTSYNLTAVRFSGTSYGWAVGEHSTYVKTTNGGTSWTAQTISDLSSDDTIYDISWSDTSNGILSTSGRKLLSTSNSGTTWTSVSSSRSVALRDIYRKSSTVWWGVGESGSIFRYDTASPTTPTNFDVSGDNDSVTDTTPSFSWTASSDAETNVASYYFKMDSGSYKQLGATTTSYTYTTELTNGDHTAYLYAVDLVGNVSGTASVNFTVDVDSTSTEAPSVKSITPGTAISGKSVTYSVQFSDDGTVSSCDLYLDGEYEKAMTVKDVMAYTTLTFTSAGTHTMYARCTDDDGNKTTGSSSTLTISAESHQVTTGNIIKIGCSGDIYVNDPCTAVYYYGNDGKRHAFPTEAVFKTWFSDFDDLVVLSSAAMAEIPLGRNVTVKPGNRLVKFSSNTVYAVSYGGVLRPIANAEIAETIFGSSWVSKIAIIDDVFYGNYRKGSVIESSANFSPSSVSSVTNAIDKTF